MENGKIDPRNPAALGAFLQGDIENAIVASTPGGIEAQEAQGQKDLIEAEVTRLPRRVHYAVGDDDTGAEKYYAEMSIRVLGIYDDLFFNVTLPDGWKLQPTEHSMNSELLDEKGRIRAGVFYKAAFYDRRADFAARTRFDIRVEPEDGYKSDATPAERNEMLRYGRVYDQEKIVFQTDGVKEADGEEYIAQYQILCVPCKKWLEENGFEHYESPLQYWD